MSSPTDTNQASEDELRESILQDIYNAAVWREHLGAIKGEAEFGDKDRHKDRLEGSGRVADLVMNKILADRKKHELDARIDENEAWYALGRMIDPREFVAEIGRLELTKQEKIL